MPSDNTKRAEPSEWATLEAQRVCDAGGAWTGELVTNIALSLDAAEQRGRESVEAKVRRLRERIAKMAEREERYRQDATQRLDDLDAASYDRSARVLRSLLVAEKEG